MVLKTGNCTASGKFPMSDYYVDANYLITLRKLNTRRAHWRELFIMFITVYWPGIFISDNFAIGQTPWNRVEIFLFKQLLVLSVPLFRKLTPWDEPKRRRVDAEAQARGPRAVVENVSQVGVSGVAADLGPIHPQR